MAISSTGGTPLRTPSGPLISPGTLSQSRPVTQTVLGTASGTSARSSSAGSAGRGSQASGSSTSRVSTSPLAVLVEPFDVLKATFASDPACLAGLVRLKDSKALESLDANGKSLLTHLHELLALNGSAVVGMPAGQDLVRSLVSDLADPSSIYQGLGTTTCTVASMQSILASGQPAEYARLARELSRSGQADMVGGGRIQILPGDFTAKDGRNPLADAFQESLFRLGTSLGGNSATASGVVEFGGKVLSAAKKVFAGAIPGGLTIDQYSRLHEMLTGNKRVLVEPDALVWNQLILNRLDEKGRDKTMNATAFLAPEPGSSVGHAIVIERLSQNPDGSLTAHIRDPMSPGVKTVPLADLQSKVQLLEMEPPQVSSSKTYLDNVTLISHR